MTNWFDSLPAPPDDFDPLDTEQVDKLLSGWQVEIRREDKHPRSLLSGWSIYWKGGAGLCCPFISEDTDGRLARSVIALSIYLHYVGVAMHLCDTMAYWYIVGPPRVAKLKAEIEGLRSYTLNDKRS